MKKFSLPYMVMTGVEKLKTHKQLPVYHMNLFSVNVLYFNIYTDAMPCPSDVYCKSFTINTI